MNKLKLKKIIALALSVNFSLLQVSLISIGCSKKVNAEVLNKESISTISYLRTTENNILLPQIKSVRDLIEEDTQRKLEEIEQRRAEEERIKKEQEEIARLEAERLALEQKEIARKEMVGVNLDNVLEPSNITAEELYQVFMFLDKPEMAQLSWAIVESEAITNINSLFLAGLIANESSYGTSYRAVYQNNVTGFAAYNSSAEGSYFVDKYSCIIQTAEWLKNEYLSPEGKYFNGYTTYHINIRYCLTEDGSATDFQWSEIINNISKTVESIYHQFIK